MKIKIDRQKCAGHARCATISPEIFRLDENGYIALEEIAVPFEMEEEARRGARACPERIIAIEE